MRFLLRADASRSLGLGHVKRCLALGQALRDCGADVALLSRAADVDIATLAADARIDFYPLAAGPDWQADAERTAGIARATGAQSVIVDHYLLDARWHRSVAAGGLRVAAIDDLADRPLDVSLLIDHNYAADHAAKYHGRLAPATRLLAGPRFALLGPSYASAPRHAVREGDVASIGIFMGGADAAGISGVAIDACRRHAGFAGPIEVATTRANPHLAQLRQRCNKDAALTLTVDAPDLAAFFARHDLQIGAGGGATWERCCIGAPTLVLRGAANQDAVIPALSALGAVAALPDSGPPTAQSVGHALRPLLGDANTRRRMAAASRALVDGLGARRVALHLCAEQLQVRPAVAADARLLYAWRNDEATRRFSNDSATIAWPQHAAWFDRVLADPARLLLVGSVGALPVGAIRFDAIDGGASEVSLYLDPALHGLGLGGHLLRAGEDRLTKHAGPPPAGFVATVLGENTGSQRLFAAGGYRNEGSRWHKAALPHNQRTAP